MQKCTHNLLVSRSYSFSDRLFVISLFCYGTKCTHFRYAFASLIFSVCGARIYSWYWICCLDRTPASTVCMCEQENNYCLLYALAYIVRWMERTYVWLNAGAERWCGGELRDFAHGERETFANIVQDILGRWMKWKIHDMHSFPLSMSEHCLGVWRFMSESRRKTRSLHRMVVNFSRSLLFSLSLLLIEEQHYIQSGGKNVR